MPNPVRSLARSMLASMFVVGGMDALQNPDGKAPVADDVAQPVAQGVGLDDVDTRTLVQLNGAAQVAGGVALALGKFPRLASAVLAASLVPTTLAAHRFWEEEEDGARAQQRIHFFKNVAMLGGLLISSQDTAGKPGAVWAAKHGVEHASDAAARLKRESGLVADAARAGAAAKRAELGRAASEAKASAATHVAKRAVKAAVAT